MTLSVLIADDEAVARRRTVRLLRERSDVEIVAQCAGGAEAVESIRELEPDLVLLDIQMPDIDGFGVISDVGLDKMPQVIFVTAYDQHAIRAFEVNAVDYIVKPYTSERFHDAVDRALKRIAQGADRGDEAKLEALLQRLFSEEARAERNGVTEEPGADRIIVRDRDRMRLVRVQDVDWIESEGNYVRLHVGTTSYLIRGNLGKLEEKLTAFGFVRVHRRFLVNVDRVIEVQPWFGGDAILILGNNAKVRLSRTFREPFEARFLSP
jgi:two-component system LytT family response regulator